MLAVVISLIGSTTTKKDREVRRGVYISKYEKGVKVVDKELNINRHESQGAWNCWIASLAIFAKYI